MKTLVLGASTNPQRFAYKATLRLLSHGHEVVLVGIKQGEVNGIEIINHRQPIQDIDTITMYVGTRNQPGWYDYILMQNPRRIIFNPGTENPELEKLAEEKGIQCIEHCTLVMLAMGVY